MFARRLLQAGRVDEAVERAREAVLAAEDAPAAVRAEARNVQSRVLYKLRRCEEALAAVEPAVTICRTAPRRSRRLSRELTWALYLQSITLTALRRHEEALSACEQALALIAAAARRRHWWVVDVRWRVRCLHVELLRRTGRPEEAVAVGTGLVRYLAGLPRLADPDSVLPNLARLAESDAAGHVRDLMRSVGLLDTVLRQVGRDEERVELWRDAVTFLRPVATTADIEGLLARALEGLGVACSGAGRPDDAIAAVTDAIGYRRRQAGHGESDEFLLASALRQRSFDLATVGRSDEARRDLEEATAILRRLADRHPDWYGAELERAVAQARGLDGAAAVRSDT